MQGKAKLYFRDAGGKFNAFKEQMANSYYRDYDLTVYSLTPAGETEPARLIVKMTPVGNPDGYLSAQRLDVKEANVTLITLDYHAFCAEEAEALCHRLGRWFPYKSPAQGFATLVEGVWGKEPAVQPISVEEFFRIHPGKEDPEAQDYLRDKAFFLSRLPNPLQPDFAALPLLTDAQKAKVTAIGMSHADVSGRRILDGLFRGYTSLQELDLSALDTSEATSMRDMFRGCESLQRLDLSAMDFRRVTDMGSMFEACSHLKEVLLSDSVLNAGGIPHASTGYTTEELNDLWKSEYIAAGPQLADRAVERASQIQSRMIRGPYHLATQEEVRQHLGLSRSVRLSIVPHRALKKQ